MTTVYTGMTQLWHNAATQSDPIPAAMRRFPLPHTELHAKATDLEHVFVHHNHERQ